MTRSLRAQVVIPLALVCLPLLNYGDTIFHRYGFRDDYSIIREAREEPAKLMDVYGSQGRPFYGWLLKISAGRTPAIADLCWLRVAGALGLGLVAAGLFFVLRRQRWPDGWAALTAALLVLLPSGQLIVAWGICWPHLVAAGLGLAAFAAAERGRGSARLGLRAAWLAAALLGLAVRRAGLPVRGDVLPRGVAGGLGRRLVGSGEKPVAWLAFHAAVMGARHAAGL